MNKVMFSSASQHWATPVEIYRVLDAEFHFDYDPCPLYCHEDRLAYPWGSRSFVNPPYGREIGKWLCKAYLESLQGKLVVCLIPSRTDTRWWHNYVMKASEIRFLKGRLKFGNAKNSAPFPSAIVVFRQGKTQRRGDLMNRPPLRVGQTLPTRPPCLTPLELQLPA